MANGTLVANDRDQWHSDGGSNPFKDAHPRIGALWTTHGGASSSMAPTDRKLMRRAKPTATDHWLQTIAASGATTRAHQAVSFRSANFNPLSLLGLCDLSV